MWQLYINDLDIPNEIEFHYYFTWNLFHSFFIVWLLERTRMVPCGVDGHNGIPYVCNGKASLLAETILIVLNTISTHFMIPK